MGSGPSSAAAPVASGSAGATRPIFRNSLRLVIQRLSPGTVRRSYHTMCRGAESTSAPAAGASRPLLHSLVMTRAPDPLHATTEAQLLQRVTAAGLVPLWTFFKEW